MCTCICVSVYTYVCVNMCIHGKVKNKLFTLVIVRVPPFLIMFVPLSSINIPSYLLSDDSQTFFFSSLRLKEKQNQRCVFVRYTRKNSTS